MTVAIGSFLAFGSGQIATVFAGNAAAGWDARDITPEGAVHHLSDTDASQLLTVGASDPAGKPATGTFAIIVQRTASAQQAQKWFVAGYFTSPQFGSQVKVFLCKADKYQDFFWARGDSTGFFTIEAAP